MKVELIGYSQMVNGHSDPMALAELAASVCYDSKPTERCGIVRQCIASGQRESAVPVWRSFPGTDTSVCRSVLSGTAGRIPSSM